MTVRVAEAADLEAVLELCRQQPPNRMHRRRLSAEDRAAFRLEQYRTQGVGTMLLAVEDGRPVGFMALATGLIDTITRDPQARIADATLTGFEVLLPAAMALARERGAAFLIYLLEEGDPRETALQAAGFIIESNRIAKRFDEPVLTEQGQRAKDVYRVRPGTPEDLFSVALLSTVASHMSIPAGRVADPMQVRQRFMDAHLSTALDETLVLVVADTVVDDELAGYMKVRLCQDESASDEIIGYIEDFSVQQAHWGAASHVLVYGIEQALHARGVHVLVGDISASNGRSLAGATRKVELHVESQRWGVNLTNR